MDSPLYERIAAKFEIADLRAQQDEIKDLRKSAYAIFNAAGFPSTKQEEWRFTNMYPYLKDDYVLEDRDSPLSEEEFKQAAALIARYQEDMHTSLKGTHKGAYRIVMINGRINEELSAFPDGDQIKIKCGAAAMSDATFLKYCGKIVRPEGKPFAALNTALFTDPLLLEVPKGTQVDKPVHILHLWLAPRNPIWVNPRSLFVLQPEAGLEVVETMLTDASDQPVFVNGVTEIEVQENAVFHHYDIQQVKRKGLRIVQQTESAQKRNSNYSNYTFTFPGSDIVRNTLALHLNAPNLESHLYGLALTSGQQLVDNHTEVHHKFPHGESNQLYKGVLLEKSKVVFNGKILVYEDAQKTNAFQQSNNILFSDHATVDAKPQLEIFADDVKCSHGTTMGQLDKDALFYLQSRGIGEASALTMMVNAFAFDVTQKIKNETLRVYLNRLITAEMQA